MTRTELGAALRRARVAAGLSLREAAPRCGLSFQQLSQIETGVQNTTIDTVVRVAEGLGVDLSIAVGDPTDTRAAVRARFERVLPLIPEEDLSPFLAQLALWERRYGEQAG